MLDGLSVVFKCERSECDVALCLWLRFYVSCFAAKVRDKLAALFRRRRMSHCGKLRSRDSQPTPGTVSQYTHWAPSLVSFVYQLMATLEALSDKLLGALRKSLPVTSLSVGTLLFRLSRSPDAT